MTRSAFDASGRRYNQNGRREAGGYKTNQRAATVRLMVSGHAREIESERASKVKRQAGSQAGRY